MYANYAPYRAGVDPAYNNIANETKVGVNQLTFPSEYPIALDDAANAARLSSCNCDYEYIESYVAAATGMIEGMCNISGIIKQFEAVYSRFPPQRTDMAIEVPRAPCVDVDRVQYLDEDEVKQTLDTAVWQARIESEKRAWIELKHEQDWPQTAYYRTAAVWVRFTAGYGNTPDEIAGKPKPEMLRHAIRLLVTHWMNIGRDPVQAGALDEIPYAIQALVRNIDPGYYVG